MGIFTLLEKIQRKRPSEDQFEKERKPQCLARKIKFNVYHTPYAIARVPNMRSKTHAKNEEFRESSYEDISHGVKPHFATQGYNTLSLYVVGNYMTNAFSDVIF